MNIRQYMDRRCICGRSRAEHAHMHERLSDGTTLLRVLPVPATSERPCGGYLDAIELELGGCPTENQLLAPLVRERLGESPGGKESN